MEKLTNNGEPDKDANRADDFIKVVRAISERFGPQSSEDIQRYIDLTEQKENFSFTEEEKEQINSALLKENHQNNDIQEERHDDPDSVPKKGGIDSYLDLIEMVSPLPENIEEINRPNVVDGFIDKYNEVISKIKAYQEQNASSTDKDA